MKILTIDTGSYTIGDILLKFDKMGISCHNLYYHFPKDDPEKKYVDDEFEAILRKELSLPYDCIFSTNYFPIISRVCHERNIKYISWSYDAPMNLPSAETMDLPTNYIFIFDREDFRKYRQMGLETVYYMPLAVNCDRLDMIRPLDNRFDTDVSFLGKLYESTLTILKNIMNEYQRGYLDALTQAQMQVYGAWFVDEALTQEFINEVNKHYKSISQTAIQISKAQLSFAVAQHITHIERLALLRLIASEGIKTDLYAPPLTAQEQKLLEDINTHGSLSYAEEMPALFKSSKINLNITLRCIKSGIPLRALDVIGSGGFLLSNWQGELAEHFIDGEEVVLYSGIDDAVEKACYYLKHDDERRRVADNGYKKARQNFKYEDRIQSMLKTSGLF